MSDQQRVDPVALLGSLAPPPGWNERTDITTNPTAASILERVIGATVMPVRRPRRHLRIVTGIVVTAAIGGTAVAALWERSPEFAAAVSCWSEPVAPPAEQVSAGWDGLSDPVEACGFAWNGGAFGSQTQPDPSTACVTDQGLTAVIPGDDSMCDALGLARFAPIDSADDVLAAAEAQTILGERYNTACLSSDEVAIGAREVLDHVGLETWTVDVLDNFSDDLPCGTVGFDTIADGVVIVGAPDHSGDTSRDTSPSVSDLTRSKINERFNGTTCVAPDGARAAVRHELDQFGLHEWNLQIADAPSVDEQCARVELDSTNMTAIVVFDGPID